MNHDGLADERFVSITTFEHDGTPISTPVWTVGENGDLLVMSEAESRKVKRIRRDGRVRLAPCTVRGAILGAPVDARATIDPETAIVERLLARKYGWAYRAYTRCSALMRRLRGQTTPAGVTIRITPR